MSNEIKTQIRAIISDVSGIPEREIGGDSHFVEELDLDSLAMLEMGVDIDHAFQLGLPDEPYKELRCLNDAVELVSRHLKERETQAEVA